MPYPRVRNPHRPLPHRIIGRTPPAEALVRALLLPGQQLLWVVPTSQELVHERGRSRCTWPGEKDEIVSIRLGRRAEEELWGVRTGSLPFPEPVHHVSL